MITKKCIGCGIKLQYEDSKKEGYVPEEKFIMEEELLCQRCFKIKNYGQNTVNNLKKEDYLEEVSRTVEKADIILPIFDIIDFESGIRALNIQCAGGDILDEWFEQIEAIANSLAKEHGCKNIYIIGRAGWARKMKGLGYKTIHTVIAKEVI